MLILGVPETWPFDAALGIVVGLAIIEGLGLLLAHSPSSLLDSLLLDLPEGMESSLGWLHIGKVPLLVLLILFLTTFALAGYLIQTGSWWLIETLLPTGIATFPAILIGLFATHKLGGRLAHFIPRDESSAVSEQSFIGRTGIIMRGIAREGMAAEAKVRDAHGRIHYLMVEPDIAGQTLSEGSNILLIKKTGVQYRCILNPHPEQL